MSGYNQTNFRMDSNLEDKKMVSGKNLAAIFVLFGCFLSGCGQPEKIEAIDKICVDADEKQEVMQAAQDVLAQMQFRIEKADESAGYIRTLPLEGGQFFEVWRDDNVGVYNFSEANLQSLRRIVELKVNPQDGQVCVEGLAKTYRLSLPESENVNVTQAFEVFTRDQSKLQEFELSDEQKEDMAWVELGEDEALSSEILRRIETAVKEDKGGKE
ncbi:MAG: hypothetical protein ACYSSP_02930 [Planctomycetota bacterium]